MARRKTRRKKTNGLPKVLIGLALTSTAEPIIDNLVSGVTGNFGLGIPDDIIKVGVGWYMSKKTGFMKGIGYGLFARGAGNVVGNLLGGSGFNLFGNKQGTGATANNDGW